ncbi:MAG: alpha/beta hydrolase [Planctomycetaceae bacterium]|jgi:fermentation-respiration switch protein FrsA (DUF1100 family)|nr:alpha/beta hydrolase [Planctomycetaceae bacterium]
MKKYRKLFYFVLGLISVFVYFIGCHADFVARKLTFHPAKYPIGNWDVVKGSAVYDVSEEVRFPNSRHQMLVGRYFDYTKMVTGDTARGSVLYCHGNAGNISHLTDWAFQLSRDLRCHVFVFDYAGYGKSEGEATASGILDDGRAARNWLAEHDGIPNDNVILYGQSLGGSVAVDIAAKDGARALIVESSFTSLGDMGQRLLPFLPVHWLLREQLASIDKISQFHNPVFISHGQADQTIPFSQGQRLFDAANEPKTFYIPPPCYDYHSAPHCQEHRQQLRTLIDSPPIRNNVP